MRSDGDGGGASACLFAFDLLRLDGLDLRPLPLEERRARLRTTLRRARPSLRIVEHLEGDGPEIYRHACALGLEGIVSKRRDSRYRSGRSLIWLKIRNPDYTRGGQHRSETMDELMEILRGMRVDADQAIQLLTSGQHKVDDAPAILDR